MDSNLNRIIINEVLDRNLLLIRSSFYFSRIRAAVKFYNEMILVRLLGGKL